jgi:hypothetical protein
MVDDVTHADNVPWTRKHDLPGAPLIPSAARIYYPTSLDDLIKICTQRAPGESLKAAGSHLALSGAAISKRSFIETHDWNNEYPAMGRTLYDVVPGCLTPDFVAYLAEFENPDEYLVHFETGKRIYQLYSELDYGDEDPSSLATLIGSSFGNLAYEGPWALPTSGAAGQQTVFGALNTGTHGGDFDRPPLADGVMAMHLVADGGKHFWIEPSMTEWSGREFVLTDEAALTKVYGSKGAPGSFTVLRDDDLFNAVLVSAGRFGVVYSVVFRVVRQYVVHQQRRLNTWQNIRSEIADTTSQFYTVLRNGDGTDGGGRPGSGGGGDNEPNHYMEIDINVVPHGNFMQNRCSINKRSSRTLYNWRTDPFAVGRAERRGDRGDFDPKIGARRFSNAGNQNPYDPSSDLLFGAFCSGGSVAGGIVDGVHYEIDKYARTKTAEAGGAIAGVFAAGGPLLDLLLPLLGPLFALIAPLLATLGTLAEPRLGAFLNDLKKLILVPGSAAGLCLWQMIALKLFEFKQANMDISALSYAVMDGFDYQDKICNVNVDSFEVFFDATDPALIKFVDALLALEVARETQGKSFIGYIALRFTGRTRALIGMQQFDVTCSVEVAGLKDGADTEEFINTAISFCAPFGGILHWGQRNDHQRADIDAAFGANIVKWRAKLGMITEGDTLNAFRNDFTVQTGLEL